MINKILKPNKLKDIIGHDKFISEDGVLSKMLEKEEYTSFLIYGEPGIGKTSLANAFANETKLNTFKLNGSKLSSVDLKNIYDKLKLSLGIKTILIIDEIHRLNVEKQNLLLFFLDNTNIILICTTNYNPYIELIPALNSRLLIFEATKNNDQIYQGILIKLKLLNLKNNYDNDFIKQLLIYKNYDIRSFFNTLLFLDNLYDQKDINLDLFKKINLFININQSSNEINHHDLKSAFQKSIRGSNVDASLFYLGCLIKNNHLDSILRRLPIIAYEDIGLANPDLCSRVCIVVEQCKKIGLPEARILLSNIVIELALSDKSNSAYQSINKVLNYLDKNPNYNIPKNIKDNSYKLNYNITNNSYINPHFNREVKQDYLDPNIKEKFYLEDLNNTNELFLNKNKRNK